MKRDRENADLALKHRLYVSGWCLSGLLKDIRSGKYEAQVKLHKIGGVPVGVAVLEGKHIQVFVNKAFRGKGIGRKLISRFKNKDIRGSYGVVGSLEFYEKCGVKAQ